MDSCPLYLEGVTVELSGRRLLLTTEVDRAVGTLRERVRGHSGLVPPSAQ